MRGSPITQAVVVMVLFLALWFAGMHLIGGGGESQKENPPAADTGMVRVDVEIYFSDPPEKYTLRRPGDGWDENEHILTIMGNDENPALHEFMLRDTDDNVVWLDVTWPGEKKDGRHFAQVVLTAGNAESKTYTFHDRGDELHGTMNILQTNKSHNE